MTSIESDAENSTERDVSPIRPEKLGKAKKVGSIKKVSQFVQKRNKRALLLATLDAELREQLET